jgi:hypothetical protein
MKEIPLTQGKVALVDDEDFETVMNPKWRWYAVKSKRHNWSWSWYARGANRHNSREVIDMHVLLMGCTSRFVQVDHRDCNGLNNQRSNLRICTRIQNCCNQLASPRSATGYKGVNRVGNHWRADICFSHKRYALGRFVTLEEAARAYDDAARKYHGEFARLNFPRAGEQCARREPAIRP